MEASDTSSGKGQSRDGRIAFAQYLEQIAVSELERAAGEVHSDAYAVAHPDQPQVRREPSLDDLRTDAETFRRAVRFLELVEEMRREE